MITIHHYLTVSAALFCLGLLGVLTRRNAVNVLMGIELILNSANINLVAFSRFNDTARAMDGQLFAVFVVVIAAAEVAVALKARKLIFLTDVAGILDENGQLISQLTATELKTRLQEGKAVKGGMAVKANAILRALEGGVDQVHVVDGRVLHSVVVELFTDRGVGTLITA